MNSGKLSNIDRKLWFTIIGFIALLILAVVMLVLVSGNEDQSRGAERYIRLSGQSGFTCEYAEAQKLYAFGEGVLKVTKERVAYLTLSGNEVFSSIVSYSNPQCYINGNNCVVFDSDGYGFIVMNTDKVLYEKPTENKIQSAILSDSGLCAVITDSMDAYGEVILYNSEGGQISRWSSYNSGYPICGAFSDNEQYFALTTLNTTGAVYKPYVRVFSIDYDNGNITASDHAVYTIDETTILSYTAYVGDQLYAFCSDCIYTVNNDSVFDFFSFRKIFIRGDIHMDKGFLQLLFFFLRRFFRFFGCHAGFPLLPFGTLDRSESENQHGKHPSAVFDITDRMSLPLIGTETPFPEMHGIRAVNAGKLIRF